MLAPSVMSWQRAGMLLVRSHYVITRPGGRPVLHELHLLRIRVHLA